MTLLTPNPAPDADPVASRRRRARRLGGLAAATLTAGVICQFLQRADPKPPLLYFTVDSAVLAAAVQTWRLARGPGDGVWGERIRGAAAVGVVLSALVYCTVIAPSSPSGTWFGAHDDVGARAATVLLHAVAPVWVVAEFLTGPYALAPSRREAVLLTCWPALYLVVVGGLSGAGAATMPYDFLRPSQIGAPAVAVAVALLYALALGLAAALLMARSLVTRRRARQWGTRQ
ncbi:Pr6Pr family membrane protein [Streptomyces sp. NPDC057438]|uniref:Pr6Pr family membrane protein n=1 Tax=Streptomyces sp. NPDC057438 TaxID=3346133 RepID=UPI0036AFC791